MSLYFGSIWACLRLKVILGRSQRPAPRTPVLLRPPPREFLERGPPASLQAAFRQFEEKTERCMEDAERVAAELGFVLPPS